MIGSAIFGLIAALAVRALLPGHPATGPGTSAILGATGGWLGAFGGEKFGLHRAPQRLLSVLGAMALMLLYSVLPR